MNDFTSLLVGGVPLMIVIFGLVEFSKSLGLVGRKLAIVSMLLGVAFGIAYQIALQGLPSAFPNWFSIFVYGLALGLVTSGFYDFADSRLPKVGP
ncbi:MAG: hypothetical protein ABSA23_15640 [Anaerolineales bacterium]